MALSTTQRRQVLKHLRVPMVSASGYYGAGLPLLQILPTHRVTAAMDTLTDDGVTVVGEYLTQLETQLSAMYTVTNAGLKRVRDVEWYQGAQFADKMQTYNFTRSALAEVLGFTLEDLRNDTGSGIREP